MGDSSKKSALVQVFGLALIFIIVLCYLIYNFYTTYSKEVSEETVTRFERQTRTAADSVESEIERLVEGGRSVEEYLIRYTPQDISLVRGLINSLESSSDAYMVSVCNQFGQGISTDSEYVNLSTTSYFSLASGQHVEYAADDGVLGSPAIVSVLPLQVDGTIKGLLCMYFSPETLSRKMDYSNFGSNAFYLIADSQGNVLTSDGYAGEYVKNGNLLEGLKEAEFEKDSYESSKMKLEMYKEGTIQAGLGQDHRTLYFTSIGINDWRFFAAVDTDYLEGIIRAKVKLVQGLLIGVILAVFLLIGTILITNFLNKYFYNENRKKLEDKANKDLLTDLSNKVATEQQIREYILNNPLSPALLLVLDVDNFKKINDTLGHAFGDDVLRELGLSLKGEFRVSDIVGRTGGDEFIIFLKNMKDVDNMHRETVRLHKFFQHFQVGEYVKYSPTASIGAAVFPQDGATFEALYRAADSALYEVKRKGKNQFGFYREDVVKSAAEEQEIQ